MNDFEPKLPGQVDQPDSVSAGGTPTTHKETSKPIAGPIADEHNKDTNHPGVMTNIPTKDGGVERDANQPSGARNDNDPGSGPNVASSNVASNQNSSSKWPAPLNMSSINKTIQDNKTANGIVGTSAVGPASDDGTIRTGDSKTDENPNYNPNPETVKPLMESGNTDYDGPVKGGQTVKVQPLNADRVVVGKVLGVGSNGLGEIMWLDEANGTKVAYFKAEDAEILHEPSKEETGKVFVNDDKTYDGRELRMERPRNEKQYVEKQKVLAEQTAKSNAGIARW